MAPILHPDSKFTLFVRKIMFFTMVNIQLLICCLPVVTFGVGLGAMFQCFNRCDGQLDLDAWKHFFPAVRQNWKQTLPAGLLFLLTGGTIALSAYGVVTTDIPAKLLFATGIGAAALIWFGMLAFYFPLTAQFENTMGRHLLHAFEISMVHLPTTGFLLLMLAVTLLLFGSSAYLLPFWTFGGFALVGYLANHRIHRILVRYGAPEYPKSLEDMEKEGSPCTRWEESKGNFRKNPW